MSRITHRDMYLRDMFQEATLRNPILLMDLKKMTTQLILINYLLIWVMPNSRTSVEFCYRVQLTFQMNRYRFSPHNAAFLISARQTTLISFENKWLIIIIFASIIFQIIVLS